MKHDYQMFITYQTGCMESHLRRESYFSFEVYEKQRQRDERFVEWQRQYTRKKQALREKISWNLRATRVKRSFGTSSFWKDYVPSLVKAYVKEPERMDLLGEVFRFYQDWETKSAFLADKFPVLRVLKQLEIRFEGEGEWRDVPWARESWWTNSPYYHSHMAHYSVKQKGLLAYQESVSKIERDVQSVMAPGRYLNKFFGSVLSPEEIKKWSEKFTAYSDQTLTLKILNNDTFAGTQGELKNEWVRLYDEVLVDHSCMRGCDYVRVYGMKGNHLGLAYLEAASGELMCRSIVRFDRGEYIRSFPYTGSSTLQKVNENQFARMLEDAGFDSGDLGNIHLLRIEYGCGDRVVMPYLDGSHHWVEDCGDYMLVGYEGIDAQQQNGYMEIDHGMTCDKCGDSGFDEDDMSYVECEGWQVCEDCLNEHYTYAYGRRRQGYYPLDECVKVDGDWYYNDTLEYHDIFCCEECGGCFKDDDRADAEDLLCTGCVVTLDVEHDDYTQARESDTATLSDGRVVHEDDADELQAEINAEEEVDGVKMLFDKTPRELNHELPLAA